MLLMATAAVGFLNFFVRGGPLEFVPGSIYAFDGCCTFFVVVIL
jgi:hypothetical protein